jgi:hypothetical protein
MCAPSMGKIRLVGVKHQLVLKLRMVRNVRRTQVGRLWRCEP